MISSLGLCSNGFSRISLKAVRTHKIVRAMSMTTSGIGFLLRVRPPARIIFYFFFDFCVGRSILMSRKAIYANAVYHVVATRRPLAGIPVPESGARYSVTVREHDVGACT